MTDNDLIIREKCTTLNIMCNFPRTIVDVIGFLHSHCYYFLNAFTPTPFNILALTASFCWVVSSWDITIYHQSMHINIHTYYIYMSRSFYWDVINECHSETTGNRLCILKNDKLLEINHKWCELWAVKTMDILRSHPPSYILLEKILLQLCVRV